MADWRTIDSAPKDGTHFDLYGIAGKRGIRVPDCYWHRNAQRWMTKHYDKAGYSALRLPFTATHRLPSPPPPKGMNDE